MPSSGVQPGSQESVLLSLKRQIDRVGRRLISLADITESGAADGEVPVWNAASGHWEPGVGAVPVLFVSDAADGPPTDGSVFWYVTDESC